MANRNKEEQRAYYLENYETIREQQRDYHYRKNHGITLLEFNAMIRAQDGKCDICGCSPDLARGKRGLNLDHNHTTGQLRALLCITCNTELGAYERRKIEFEEYLVRFGE